MGPGRREFLTALGAGATVSIAGCSGGDKEVTETPEETETEGSTETETPTPEPLMEGEEAYEDTQLTDGDVQSIRFEEFDHNIPSVERLVETSYEEEDLNWKVQGARTREEALRDIFEFASGKIDYYGADVADDDADAIAVARELVRHADEYSNFSFDYEDTMIDEHTVYGGAVGQSASVLFKGENGEWNHHYADPFKAEWRGPAVGTDYFSEDPGHTASTQSPRGFFGYLDTIGVFERNSDVADWAGFEKRTSNLEFGKTLDSGNRIYFEPETFHEKLPQMLRENISEYVNSVRHVNEIMKETSAEAVEFSHDGDGWNHTEVEQDPAKFKKMMEYRLEG